jgi:hypothetical protein
VYDAVAATTDSQAARLLSEQPEAVFSRIVLAAEGGALPGPAAGGDPAANVRVVEYTPKRSVWRVRTGRAGYLFTSDAFYPGWKAELDGRPVALHRANIAFRAVYVPPGEHLIVHAYEPLSIRLGLALSLASLAAAGLLLVVPSRRRDADSAGPVAGAPRQ